MITSKQLNDCIDVNTAKLKDHFLLLSIIKKILLTFTFPGFLLFLQLVHLVSPKHHCGIFFSLL